MTYIELINRFWKIQQTEDFSSNEVYLYFFLLNECNLRGWQNKFEYPNRKIVLATGMSEPTVIACRCRLQQKGLLQFEAGKRNAKSPVYYLNDFSKDFSKPLSKKLSHNKTREIRENIIPPTPPKGEEINKKARSVFEEHFKITFSADYYWTAKDAGAMAQLLNKLRFSREQKNMPVDDASVLYALQVFLSSIKEGWIFENFSVTNINSKFNEIVSQARTNGKNNNGKDKYEQKRINSEQRKLESLANVDIIRAAAEKRRKELEATGVTACLSGSDGSID